MTSLAVIALLLCENNRTLFESDKEFYNVLLYPISFMTITGERHT